MGFAKEPTDTIANVTSHDKSSQFLEGDIRTAQTADSDIAVVIRLLQSRRLPSADASPSVKSFLRHDLYLEEDIVWRKAHDSRQLVVPLSLVPRVLQVAHDDPTAGHQGANKTLDRLLARFWRPTVRQDVAAYTQSCHRCGERNHPTAAAKAPLCQRPRPSRPFDIVETDIKGPLPLSPDGYRYLLVFQDAFSKYAEMTPIATASAHTVSNQLREWIGRYGIPRTIHSDQGACYTSTTFNELCAKYGIRHTVSSAYHPQANGSVERLNRSIGTTLAKVVHHSQTDWPDRLPDVQLAYNSAKHDTINASPFRIIFKQGARTMTDSLADHLQSTPQADIQQSQERNGFSSHPQPTDTLQCTQELYDRVADHLNIATFNQQTRYNQSTHHTPYGPGDHVWLYQPRVPRGKARTLTPVLCVVWSIIQRYRRKPLIDVDTDTRGSLAACCCILS